MTSFHQLPTELIEYTLAKLDCASLCICKQVCHLFFDIIKDTAELQYIINLKIAGQEDATTGTNRTDISNKTACLTRFMEHWNQLKWTSEEIVPMHLAGLWELYGNVLAQNDSGPRVFRFKQLSSDLRGVAGKEWTVGYPAFEVRDFGMDPSQDLLLFIEEPVWTPPVNHNHRFHLRKLSTGESHPLAMKGGCFEFEAKAQDHALSYTIQLSGCYIAVHIRHLPVELKQELIVFNWKTGELKLHLTGNPLRSFAFLSESHIIVVIQQESVDPYFKVINFEEAEKDREVDAVLGPYVTTLELPEMDETARLETIVIRCDPAPAWASNLESPFYTSPTERLYVITLWVQTELLGTICYAFMVPLLTFLKHLDDTRPFRRVRWDEWGPDGTRIIELPIRQSNIWVCYVYGSKYIVPRPYQTGTHSGVDIDVYDFNQTAARYTHAQNSLETKGERFGGDGLQVVMETSEISEETGSFEERLITRLPCRTGSITRRHWLRTMSAVLLSEDSIIVVRNDHQYEILNF